MQSMWENQYRWEEAKLKLALKFDHRTLYNPTKKTISSVLRGRKQVQYEMSLYLMKSRIDPTIISHLYNRGYYQTSSGAKLILHKNMVYLTVSSMINSLRDVTKLEKKMELGKQEILIHYPIYPENIRNIEMFNNMLGGAWKKN